MRRVRRLPLSAKVNDYLRRKQNRANMKRVEGTLTPTKEWDSARQTKKMESVLLTLQRMMGPYERCMYCHDSHGADIEHFWPKSPYPEKMFSWPNLLLCCTECDRFKGERFPLDNGKPLLIDPTVDEPWDDLDFDPITGNIAPKFNLASNSWSEKGVATVEVLQLDRREALSAVYLKTFRRLSSVLTRYLNADAGVNVANLLASLREADDHGILGWCLHGDGCKVSPFSEFRARYPEEWTACVTAHRSA